MPLVPAKCPSCGGDMQIDNSRKEAFCPYCGSKFLVESAVNYYNTKNEYHIEHAEFKVEDPNGLEAKLKNAETYLVKLKDYSSAEKLYLDITDEFASDWRGWWGLARAKSHDFIGLDASGSIYRGNARESFRAYLLQRYAKLFTNLPYIDFAVKNALAFAPEEKCAEMQPIWDAYEKKAKKCYEKIYKIKELASVIRDKYAERGECWKIKGPAKKLRIEHQQAMIMEEINQIKEEYLRENTAKIDSKINWVDDRASDYDRITPTGFFTFEEWGV